jgi:hypothetical protein
VRRMITMLQGVIKLNGVGGFYHIWSMWDDNVADSVNVISQEDDCNASREDQAERSGPCEDGRQVVVWNCRVMRVKSHKHI